MTHNILMPLHVYWRSVSFKLLEKGMAIHSSILAWRIPWTEEPGRLYGSWSCKRVGHD